MPRVAPWLLALSVLGTAATAAAADPGAMLRAAELNREAGEHAKRGEWTVAAALLTEAYHLNKDPALLVNLAATELKANRAVDALHHLRAYLADPAADDKVKSAIQSEILPRAMAATGRIAIRFPSGATLSLDGEALPSGPGATNWIEDVMPGAHTVEIHSPGAVVKRFVDVPPGATVEVQPDASASGVPALARDARGRATCPGATKLLDSWPHGAARAARHGSGGRWSRRGLLARRQLGR